jgi:predicted DNA-binding helix-hairpin-helix protein
MNKKIPKTPLLREHRLYQADFLLRDYGFEAEDSFFDDKECLPLRQDPKFYFAMRREELFPVNINEAGFAPEAHPGPRL